MTLNFDMRRLATTAMLITLASSAPALAQGKGHGKNKVPPGHAKKVTPHGSIVVVRDVFVHNGFDVVRIEHVGVTEVVYYRRGNMGRGRGKGPLEHMIIRPSNDIIVFDGGPPTVLVDVRLKLGLTLPR
jgi:hypothetical protein